MSEPAIRVLRQGDTGKSDPFTIAFVANPALEAPWRSHQFQADPIVGNQSLFDQAVDFSVDSLYGHLPGQAERLLDVSGIRNAVRIVSLFATGLPATDANSLVGQDGGSFLIVARRTAISPFLARFGIHADVVFAVTDSASHDRSSAWAATDDSGRPGVSFRLDGATLLHRHYSLVPGTIAFHAGDRELTPLHEFQHAMGSFQNGQIVDLYVDGEVGVNNKRGRPIPSSFARYDGTVHGSDFTRDGLGYPPSWRSYHCELHSPSLPAVMDNYTQATSPLACENDTLTRRFLHDRLRVKIGR